LRVTCGRRIVVWRSSGGWLAESTRCAFTHPDGELQACAASRSMHAVGRAVLAQEEVLLKTTDVEQTQERGKKTLVMPDKVRIDRLRALS
jgi:hypothetical protein